MCDFNEKEIDQENVELTLENMSKDQLISVVEQLMSIKDIEVDIDDVQGIKLDKKEFEKGIKLVSLTCGMISALTSVGLTKDQVMDYVINEQNINFNLKLNQMTCDSNKETAKIQQTVQEQNQI
jgi:hypothetical protein